MGEDTTLNLESISIAPISREDQQLNLPSSGPISATVAQTSLVVVPLRWLVLVFQNRGDVDVQFWRLGAGRHCSVESEKYHELLYAPFSLRILDFQFIYFGYDQHSEQ